MQINGTGIERPEGNPYINGQLILNKGFTNSAGITGYPHAKKKTLVLTAH